MGDNVVGGRALHRKEILRAGEASAARERLVALGLLGEMSVAAARKCAQRLIAARQKYA